MANRSYFVKLNLDDVGHAVIEYDEPSDLGMWFKGFMVGAHGKQLKPDAHPAYQAGHAYGALAFRESEAFREKQSDLAKKRWGADAKPMPRHDSGIHHGTIPDGCQGISQDGCQIDGNQQPATSNQKSESKSEHPGAREHDSQDPFFGSPNPPSNPESPDRLGIELAQPWASGLKSAGCKIGPNNWPAWKTLVETHGNEAVRAAAAHVPAPDRFPDHVEAKLTGKPSQEKGTASNLPGKVREWYLAKTGLSNTYVKSETLLEAVKKFGLDTVIAMGRDAVRHEVDPQTKEHAQDFLLGRKSAYGGWDHYRPRIILAKPLDDAAVLAAIARTIKDHLDKARDAEAVRAAWAAGDAAREDA